MIKGNNGSWLLFMKALRENIQTQLQVCWHNDEYICNRVENGYCWKTNRRKPTDHSRYLH
jgi:hypothetical protein